MNQPEILPCRKCGTTPSIEPGQAMVACAIVPCPMWNHHFTVEDWNAINAPSPTWDFRETARVPMDVPCLAWNKSSNEWHMFQTSPLLPEYYDIWCPLPPAPVVKEESKFERWMKETGLHTDEISRQWWNKACIALGKEEERI